MFNRNQPIERMNLDGESCQLCAAVMLHVLRLKLRETLREQMGATYDVNIGHSVQRIPDGEYRIDISLGCKPDSIGDMVAAVFDLVDHLTTAKGDELYITKVREIRLRTYEADLKTNGYWLSAPWWSYYHQSDPLDILEYRQLVNTTSAETVQRAAELYFDNGNCAAFALYPEEDHTEAVRELASSVDE